MKRFALVVVCLCLLLGITYLIVPNARDEAQGLSRAVVADVSEPTTANGDFDHALILSSQNTTIGFSCAKRVAGKTLVVHGGWNGRFHSTLEGQVSLNPTTGQPQAVRARIRIDSLWSEHDDLTHALLNAGFFAAESFPWAEFTGHYEAHLEPASAPGDAAPPTGTLVGAFTLNGIQKHIAFPVRIEQTQAHLRADAVFSLDRRQFDVVFRETAGFGLLTDDAIADDVAVKMNFDVTLAPPVDPRRAAGAPTAAGPPAPAPGALPQPDIFVQTIPATQVDFDMIRVPGNPDAGLPPFYIGKHEVTWNEFMPWVRGNDLDDESEVGMQRAVKLRPSSPYGSVDRNFGMFKRPALGMSWRAAELYCDWLSAQTGRTYRLPTEAEWEHAYVGGAPAVSVTPPSDPDAVATHHDVSWSDNIGDWSTSKIGTHEPNALGIHDMAGNAAEWVAETPDGRVVRGGHFESPTRELGVGREVEDQAVWNLDYPNEPKSIWWYVNARWVGFRVVCESAPAAR